MPLCFSDFQAISDLIYHWPSVHIPEWQGFCIKEAGKYLGLWIGPGASELSWDKSLEKHWKRVATIASCGLSTAFSIMAYNTYALSILSYVSQFLWVPFEAIKLEHRALAKILHSPMYAVGTFGSFA